MNLNFELTLFNASVRSYNNVLNTPILNLSESEMHFGSALHLSVHSHCGIFLGAQAGFPSYVYLNSQHALSKVHTRKALDTIYP